MLQILVSIMLKSNTSSQILRDSLVQEEQVRGRRSELTMILKILNIVLGLVIGGFGGYCYKAADLDIVGNHMLRLLLPGYLVFSGLIILLIECNFRVMRKYMRFLYNYIGRGLFNIYAGAMPLCLLPDSPDTEEDKLFKTLTLVLSALMGFVGVMYILAKILCCAKESNKKKQQSVIQ